MSQRVLDTTCQFLTFYSKEIIGWWAKCFMQGRRSLYPKWKWRQVLQYWYMVDVTSRCSDKKKRCLCKDWNVKGHSWLFLDFAASAGSLGTNERTLSFQGSAALVTMWFRDPLAKLWLELWLSFSSLSCNKKVRPLAFVLHLLSCFRLEQDFRTACYSG